MKRLFALFIAIIMAVMVGCSSQPKRKTTENQTIFVYTDSSVRIDEARDLTLSKEQYEGRWDLLDLINKEEGYESYPNAIWVIEDPEVSLAYDEDSNVLGVEKELLENREKLEKAYRRLIQFLRE